MWKTIKSVVGLGIALMILGVVAKAIFLPVMLSPNPTRAIDNVSTSTMNFLGSSPPQGGDPRIVTWLFLLGLIFLFLFILNKLRGSARKAFGPAPKEDHGKKKKKDEH